MAFLKEWTFCVCCSLVTAVILSLLAPSGGMKRFYKILIALFIFLSFLYPFRDFKGFELSLPSTSPMEEAETMQNNLYQRTAEQQIKALLTERGVVGASVACEVQVNEETGEITLQSVQVAVPDDYDTIDISRMIEEALGVKAKVIHLGE